MPDVSWQVEIRRSLCIGCGACIARCPAGAIRMQPGWFCRIEPAVCIGCLTCVELCHRHAPRQKNHS